MIYVPGLAVRLDDLAMQGWLCDGHVLKVSRSNLVEDLATA
jgi:hypothetical protein